MTYDELKDRLEIAATVTSDAYEAVYDLGRLADVFSENGSGSVKVSINAIQDDFIHAMKCASARIAEAHNIVCGYRWDFRDHDRPDNMELVAAITELEEARAARENGADNITVDGSKFPFGETVYMKEGCGTETDEWNVSKDSGDEVIISTDKQEKFE